MSHQSELISTDIHAYLEQHERKELLRMLTCGSVDDGKSTLIGRLLHDSKMIYEDQLASIKSDSAKVGTTGEEVDLALLVDGLQAEREQGITIDVAYRYFSTSKRKFIIADTPGHEQYTRNMATGASTCDLAVILIDARYGVQAQTRRHTIISTLLGIKHIIVAVNKMDLVDFDEAVFNKIKDDYLEFAKKLNKIDLYFIPISALKGDNVVNASKHMSWYKGAPLMPILESVEISHDKNLENVRLPVQYVNRPNLDFRGYCGTMAGGIIKKGDNITVLPSGKTSSVESIVTYEGEIDEAYPPMAITLTLNDEIDVSRGDMIICTDDVPIVADQFDANIVWMAEAEMKPGKQYYIKIGTKSVIGSISTVNHRIDINSLDETEANVLQLNEIGHCHVAVNAPVVFDSYILCKHTGAFIIIDRISNVTVGAGMITGIAEEFEFQPVNETDHLARYGQKAISVYITGSNNKDFAEKIERALFDAGYACCLLDENAIKVDIANATQLINHAGLIALCCVEKTTDKSQTVFNSEQTSFNEALNFIRKLAHTD